MILSNGDFLRDESSAVARLIYMPYCPMIRTSEGLLSTIIEYYVYALYWSLVYIVRQSIVYYSIIIFYINILLLYQYSLGRCQMVHGSKCHKYQRAQTIILYHNIYHSIFIILAQIIIKILACDATIVEIQNNFYSINK